MQAQSSIAIFAHIQPYPPALQPIEGFSQARFEGTACSWLGQPLKDGKMSCHRTAADSLIMYSSINHGSFDFLLLVCQCLIMSKAKQQRRQCVAGCHMRKACQP